MYHVIFANWWQQFSLSTLLFPPGNCQCRKVQSVSCNICELATAIFLKYPAFPLVNVMVEKSKVTAWVIGHCMSYWWKNAVDPLFVTVSCEGGVLVIAKCLVVAARIDYGTVSNQSLNTALQSLILHARVFVWVTLLLLSNRSGAYRYHKWRTP